MNDLTYEQLLKLIEIATEKGFFDFAALFISSSVTLLAVGMSYFFFKSHAIQVTNEKVIEKEVEKLYEAVDCLFEFCNSIDLYFSMKEKSLLKMKSGEAIDSGFKKKVDDATDDVFANFRYVHKAAFIIRALGEFNTSSKIDVYRSEAVQLRKDIYEVEIGISNEDGAEKLNTLLSEYASRVNELNKQKIECLDAVALCKKNIKSVA